MGCAATSDADARLPFTASVTHPATVHPTYRRAATTGGNAARPRRTAHPAGGTGPTPTPPG
ncbi:hypothetical protein FRAAL5258 [Frankia alni ACN14a]|uniref:Uncharacterized protein n=1 Tax=Frankia alni (strain DSM 45986 / CECT 9034 / ACN14a) TaxID=326424 RepID=Q0RF59_FRAAA|nr:hypothetical protein FRAAL5258 [Frankia alni ACN14a]